MRNKLNNFIQFLNERYEIGNLPKNIELLSIIDNKSTTFLLYDINVEKPIGYIGFGLYPTINSYTVGGAYSEHGYGPFLYECEIGRASCRERV